MNVDLIKFSHFYNPFHPHKHLNMFIPKHIPVWHGVGLLFSLFTHQVFFFMWLCEVISLSHSHTPSFLWSFFFIVSSHCFSVFSSCCVITAFLLNSKCLLLCHHGMCRMAWMLHFERFPLFTHLPFKGSVRFCLCNLVLSFSMDVLLITPQPHYTLAYH